MFHNREYEIELLSRHIDQGLKYNPDYLYHEDIKKAWKELATQGITDALFQEIASKNVILYMKQDKELKREVTEMHNKRKITEHAKLLMQSVNDYSKVSELVKTFNIVPTTEVKVVDNGQVAREELERIFDIADGKIPPAMQTGTPIDRIDGGFRNEYILIAARPSVGKSVTGLQISVNKAREGLKVGYFSLEMSKKALINRYLYHMARVSANNAKNRILSNEQREKLKQAAQEIATVPIEIIDEKCDVYDIIEKCKEAKYDVVIVDYLQRIKPHRSATRREVIEEISHELSELPKEIEAPVITIASLSRPQDKANSPRPKMTELKETSNLEYDADVVILLHRENPEGQYLEDCEAICTKNRNGQTGVVDMKIRGSVYRFD